MSDQYAVIGNPIGHTKSPLIHGLFAEESHQDISYTAIEGPLEPDDAFAATVRSFFAAGGKGMNVTAPFKLKAFAMADERSERAALAGAANTLSFRDGRIIAENFDGVGLVRDIEVNLNLPMAGKRVLVLGAGGAVRGALLPFIAARPAELVVANRDVAKVEALIARVATGDSLVACGYDDLAAMGRFDLVVNATSASLSGELPPVPPSVFDPRGAAYELVYGKRLTPFLRHARHAGVLGIADGVGMLVEQAAEAFAWWRGVRPETRAVIDRLTVPLD
ncbi:shikimate dehydrogenase [Burkholderia sp. SIMBA_043]|jgi:shikimate dehydrogenase|uniref:shikimate dehydrogenase n=1 Tax=Burkholderia TaxID=32008 RepID=UPI00025F09BE|nr:MULTISPECIES: shikimate dehydrogenase [Burkholderia]AFJ88824.1 Shikimate 5-dehydrogenase I alpha [Burkholderia sp. KJ006]AJY04327.1 shikimate dehydrogenase [Burkholderia vietnamiensis LMG 10929]AVR12178.1 shikimate dehydrogenase [Burkholderia vietnamiensis]KVE25207.1 shikimate dehydrogenase [Burkholderia vietnamiensis]KVG09714.1 shikimate dehydrogenase [Burkholderia vietnamiensis]